MNLHTGHRGPRYLPPPSLSHLLSHYPSPTPFFTSLSAIILASEILPMFYFSGVPSPGAQMPHPTGQGPCFRAALPQRLSGFRFFLLVSDTLHLAPSHPWLLPVSLSAQCANFSGPVPPSYVPHTAQTKAEDVTSWHSAVVLLSDRMSQISLPWLLSHPLSAAWVVFTWIPASSFQCYVHERVFVVPISRLPPCHHEEDIPAVAEGERRPVFIATWQDQRLCNFLLYHWK